MSMRKQKKENSRGFSLVEMIVAVALFAIVMLVSIGALMSLITANRKARALESTMNNLNIALDGMVRSIRMGSTYHCGGSAPLTSTFSCPDGDTQITFEPLGGSSSNAIDQWTYSYSGTTLYKKSPETGASAVPITAPEVEITEMKFYVVGTGTGNVQPKVVMVIKGTAGAIGSRTRTTFSIQATAVQRVLDI